jgi:NAD-dependent dihydropyrimidine dehydrogenase PreA subunit
MPDKASPTIDIFGLLSDTGENEEKEKKKRRKELLEPTGVNEIFKEGTIKINPYTCVGGQCKLCIKACPTNALYWSNNVGIIEDLCVYCGACELICMVDNCIQIERTRENGAKEKLNKPADVLTLTQNVATQKRLGSVKAIFPTKEKYVEKCVPNNWKSNCKR